MDGYSDLKCSISLWKQFKFHSVVNLIQVHCFHIIEHITKNLRGNGYEAWIKILDSLLSLIFLCVHSHIATLIHFRHLLLHRWYIFQQCRPCKKMCELLGITGYNWIHTLDERMSVRFLSLHQPFQGIYICDK